MGHWVNISLVLVTFLATLHFSQSQSGGKEDYLLVHNFARQSVGVKLLTWNEDLANSAKMSARGNCSPWSRHYPYGAGANSAAAPGLTGFAAVRVWAGEKPNYDHNTNTCKGGPCGNYTQMVWRNTVRFGCNQETCSDGVTIVVCHYSPFGNVKGQKPY